MTQQFQRSCGPQPIPTRELSASKIAISDGRRPAHSRSEEAGEFPELNKPASFRSQSVYKMAPLPRWVFLAMASKNGGPIVEGTKFVGLDVHKEHADSRQFTSQLPAWRGALILDAVVSRANRFLLPNVSFWVRIIIG
jgi:hypothetical protein